MFSKFFFTKLCHFLDNVEKYGTARKTTEDYKKATDTYSECLILIVFAPQPRMREPS